MREEYIFDGEIHPISKDYAYVMKRIEGIDIDGESSQLRIITREFCEKYAEYLYSFGKERVIKMMVEDLMAHNIFGYSSEDFQFIYRPAHIASALSQFSTAAIKFKRVENDNLDEKSE